MTVAEQRDLVVSIARSWIGTPWHHAARVKGAGVDCGQFLAAVFTEAGLVGEPVIAPYRRDWFLHRDDEHIVNIVLGFTLEVSRAPLAGDIVAFKFGRAFSHTGIVTHWPEIIHAYIGQPVVPENVMASAHLRCTVERPGPAQTRAMRTFSLKAWQ